MMTEAKLNNSGVVARIILIIIIISFGIYQSCQLPQKEKENKSTPSEMATKTVPQTDDLSNSDISDIRPKLFLVCVESHTYYFARLKHAGAGGLSWSYETIFAPKLTDEGKPVKCGLELEKSK